MADNVCNTQKLFQGQTAILATATAMDTGIVIGPLAFVVAIRLGTGESELDDESERECAENLTESAVSLRVKCSYINKHYCSGLY